MTRSNGQLNLFIFCEKSDGGRCEISWVFQWKAEKKRETDWLLAYQVPTMWLMGDNKVLVSKHVTQI